MSISTKKEEVLMETEKPKGMIPFRVYFPEDKKNIINKFISYAKLHCDNQVWKAMDEAFKLIEEKESYKRRFYDELPERISQLEMRITAVENALEKQEGTEEEELKTFGSEKNE